MSYLFTADDARRNLETGEGWHREPALGECYIDDEIAPSGFGRFLPYYEAFFDELPPGMEPRHICLNGRRGCIRPDHMEPVFADEPRRDPDPSLLTEIPGFARLIRDEREARGMSRPEFAKELRLSEARIISWETGRRMPEVDMLRWLAKYFGWDGQERRFVVTVVVQRIETADSGGRALRNAWAHIERMNGGPRKAAVVSVKPLERG